MRAKLEEMVVKLGLTGRVFLPGATKDIAAEYLSAQLFVMSSRYESFGLTTVEALAHGLPVVGFSDCPGTNQLIDTGVNGVLAESSGKRSASLALALKSVLTDDKLRARLGEQSGRSVDRYRLDSVCDRWEAVFNDVMRPGKILMSAPALDQI